MAVPPQHKPGACTSCLCLVLLVVGLLCALQDEPPIPKPRTKRSPRPPQPLRTFDDVKLDLFEAGAEVLQVSYSPPPTTPLEALLQPAGSSSLVELAKAALPVLSSLASLDVKAGQPLALDADIRDRYRLQDDRWMS